MFSSPITSVLIFSTLTCLYWAWSTDSSSAELVVLMFGLLLIKMVSQLSHFLSLLILVEMLLMFVFFEVNFMSLNMMSPSLVFVLMVFMVMGACLGLSMMVVVSRSFSKSLEMSKLKL